MKISLIVAVAHKGVIGQGTKIPWRIPTDMKRFVDLTAGHPVIMGRVTYESIPSKFRPLDKGRTNIVVTRDPSHLNFDTNGITLTSSPGEALDKAMKIDQQEIFIAGGAEIYRALLPRANTVHLTKVDADVEGDVFFPLGLVYQEGPWMITAEEEPVQGPKDQYPITFQTLSRG